MLINRDHAEMRHAIAALHRMIFPRAENQRFEPRSIVIGGVEWEKLRTEKSFAERRAERFFLGSIITTQLVDPSPR